jgi:membrane protein YdbS with pleckstrin-like domain
MLVGRTDDAAWLPVALTAGWPILFALLAWRAHVFPELHYRHTTWRIDEIGLTIRTGVVWRVEISVARSRVQHIDVSQGPLERRFGLGTLAVYTAGTEHSQVTLDGLEHGVALAARDRLLPARDADAV